MDTSKPSPQPTSLETVSAPDKRSFLAALLGIGGAAVSAALSVPLLRFVLYPVLTKTTEIQWSDVGATSDLQPGPTPIKRLIQVQQRDGWRKLISEKAVYIVQDQAGKLRVLSPICPHLGCSVAWNDGHAQFVCPCHGGTFSGNGTRISGPPPRSMDELESKIEDGILKVHYQYFRQLASTRQALS
jgi:menaquinol-cytochrome c reductase iron-sulfur subunit